MQNVFKRFGGKDTGLFSKKFFTTRLSLTTVYMVLLAIFLVLSGAITRTLFAQKLDVRYAHLERRGNGPTVLVVQQPTLDDVQEDLAKVLMIVNGILIILAGVASYALASLTIRPIREAYEKQRQFLSDASHELRTPLAILQADLENERVGASESSLKQIESHLEEIRRMSGLVSDVLLLSKMEATAESSAPLSPVSINDIVDTVCRRLASIAEEHHVTLTTQLSESSLNTFANTDALVRCFTNIVENAILYNRHEGTVTITTSIEDHFACIKIVDTGMGIAQDDVVKIFDRFYRAEKSRSRRTGGTGLGLSIARSIVESLSGSIALSSVVGEGTSVHILLPIHTAS